MVSRPQLQASAIATWQSHDPHDHGSGWQSQLYSYHQYQQKEQDPFLYPFFKIHTSDLSTTVSARKYIYTDDLAIMHADGDWQAVEGVLSKD